MKCLFAVPPRHRLTGDVAVHALSGGSTRALALALVLASVALVPRPALALSGDLDPDFGVGGKLTVPVAPGANHDNAFALALEPDGRILAVGYAADTPRKFAAVRLLDNGALDTTLGGTGVVLVPMANNGRAEASAVARGASSKIVLAGFSVLSGHEEFTVVRLDSNGSFDLTFAGGQPVTVPLSGTRDARARAVAVLDDQRIVVGGWVRSSSANRDVALVRLEMDGDLDPTFGTGGKVVLNLGSSHDEIAALAIDDQDRIVVAGFAADGVQNDFLVARFLPNGTLDPSFNGTGVLTVDFDGLDDDARALALVGDGKILVAGTATIAGVSRFAVVRVDEGGFLDPTFGEDGTVTTPIGTKAEGNTLAVEGSGRFVVAGKATLSGVDAFAVAQYRTDGSLAPNFGSAGVVTFKIGNGAEAAFAAAIEEDGHLVVAGTARAGSHDNFGFARLLVTACGNGLIDPGEACDSNELGGATCCSLTCQIEPIATVCRSAQGVCDAPEVCDGIDDSCPADVALGAGTVCRASAGICDVTEFCNGADKTCPDDQVLSAGALCRAAAGVCDTAETCNGAGVACPADLMKTAGTTCRSAAGVCDVAEVCDGSAPSCPGDAIAPQGTVCRSAAGTCDVAELCDGISVTCPTDEFEPAATVCRSAAGDCDVAEACDGLGPACPADERVSAGTLCRASGGDCDVAESCDGDGAACPPDVLLGAETVCRAATDACDAVERCSGASPSCPDDAISPAGTVCRPAASACDAPEACDGAEITCPADEVLPAATVCREVAGACDVAEECDGVSAVCPDDVLLAAGNECRAAAGACDVAEECDGIAAACPADALLPAETVCRASVDVCDAPDKCSGAEIDCPPDRKRRDKDGDGICDLADVCPRDADPDQADGDGDGIGDLCDLCTSDRPLAATLIEIADYATPGGDDTFKLKGEITFDTSPILAPATTGVRVLIRNGAGKILYNLVIPPGARDPVTRTGWRSNDARGVYAFSSTTPVRGVVRKVKLSQPAARPGVVKITVTGRNGGFATLPVALPLSATVILDPTPTVVELCAEAAFPGPAPAPACAFDESETRLTCQ